MSHTIIGNGTIMYHFLLTFYSRYVPTLYHLQDAARYLSKITNYSAHVFGALSGVISTGFCEYISYKKTRVSGLPPSTEMVSLHVTDGLTDRHQAVYYAHAFHMHSVVEITPITLFHMIKRLFFEVNMKQNNVCRANKLSYYTQLLQIINTTYVTTVINTTTLAKEMQPYHNQGRLVCHQELHQFLLNRLQASLPLVPQQSCDASVTYLT